MNKSKKKFEFSKLIIFIFGIVEISVVVFTCYMVYLTHDLSPLSYLIPSTAIVGATGVKYYYDKAKRENIIKLKKENNVPVESCDFADEEM